MRDSTMSRKKHDTTPIAAAAELAHGLLGEDDAKPLSETRADWIEILADTARRKRRKQICSTYSHRATSRLYTARKRLSARINSGY
jgi:hypothetical protein